MVSLRFRFFLGAAMMAAVGVIHADEATAGKVHGSLVEATEVRKIAVAPKDDAVSEGTKAVKDDAVSERTKAVLSNEQSFAPKRAK